MNAAQQQRSGFAGSAQGVGRQQQQQFQQNFAPQVGVTDSACTEFV